MEPTQSPLSGNLPDGFSEALSKLMANPQVLGAVASALGKEPPGEATSAPPPTEEVPVPSPLPSTDAIATLAPLLAGLSGSGKPPDNDRTRLLCALKPYVNPKRKDAIDTLLRFSGMTELLGHLNHPNRS